MKYMCNDLLINIHHFYNFSSVPPNATPLSLLSTFLTEGVLESKTYLAKIDLSAQEQRSIGLLSFSV